MYHMRLQRIFIDLITFYIEFKMIMMIGKIGWVFFFSNIECLSTGCWLSAFFMFYIWTVIFQSYCNITLIDNRYFSYILMGSMKRALVYKVSSVSAVNFIYVADNLDLLNQGLIKAIFTTDIQYFSTKRKFSLNLLFSPFDK